MNQFPTRTSAMSICDQLLQISHFEGNAFKILLLICVKLDCNIICLIQFDWYYLFLTVNWGFFPLRFYPWGFFRGFLFLGWDFFGWDFWLGFFLCFFKLISGTNIHKSSNFKLEFSCEREKSHVSIMLYKSFSLSFKWVSTIKRMISSAACLFHNLRKQKIDNFCSKVSGIGQRKQLISHSNQETELQNLGN